MSDATRIAPHRYAAIPALAALLAGLRWLVQGDGNIYTTTAKTLYVPDPDLEWRVADASPLWLGLDAVAAVVAVTLAVLAGGFALRRWQRRAGRPLRGARVALAAAAVAPLALPVAAFVSGSPPEGARTLLPGQLAAAPEAGIEGGIPDMPAGTYVVVDHPETNLVASLEAGGDSFEARWDRGVRGRWRGDPSDLNQPMTAEIVAAAAEVDTGIGRRSDHTRDYLRVDDYPELAFELMSIDTAGPRDGGVAYSARGEVGLMGRHHPVEITGTLRPVSSEARERLDLPAGDLLLAAAKLSLHLEDTALAGDADSFDVLEIPIQASLVLRHDVDS